jgi:SAM-dependent methyltransferase
MAIAQDIRLQAFTVLHSNPVKRVLTRIPVVREVYGGWRWRHPFDREHGTDTSGFVGVEALQPDPATGKLMNFYGGSQPGIVRRVLETLPDKEKYTLVDLGCGKGRPLFVASEFPFKDIIGVDISQAVLDIARKNVAIVKERFPDRPPIELVHGNAFQFVPPGNHVVFFLYHPFARGGVEQFAAALEQKIAEGAHVFVVYYNPVWGDVLDASSRLSRWSAASLPYEPEEVGFGPDLSDTVVVWQSSPKRYASLEGAEQPIVVTTPGGRADLAPARVESPRGRDRPLTAVWARTARQ